MITSKNIVSKRHINLPSCSNIEMIRARNTYNYAERVRYTTSSLLLVAHMVCHEVRVELHYSWAVNNVAWGFYTKGASHFHTYMYPYSGIFPRR